MADLPDVTSVVKAAAAAVEASYGVTIHQSAKDVLLRWAEAHPDVIERMARDENWTSQQFIDAAKKVLGAAAIRTMNPPGSLKYLTEPDDLVRDKDVGDYATRAVLPDSCPFYGC